MSEVWIAATITVGGGVISGYGQQKKAEEDRKNANEDRKAATREEALYGGVMSQFERELDDYYNQLNRQRKQRGLDTFKQFSTLNQFAPNYTPAAQQEIVVPDKPNIATQVDEVVRLDNANQQAAASMNAGGQKKGGSNTAKKIVDPLGLF